MLQLRGIIKDFADRRIFAGIDWHIRPSDRIGLCGDNGAGKSTLLKLLCGRADYDDGVLQIAKGTTFGYLPQEGLEHRGRTLFEETHSALEELLAIETEMRLLEQAIAENHSQDDMDRYAELQEQFEQRGGYTMEAEVGKILTGLGFSTDDFERPCENFSGGWQMRIALAKLLLQRPNLLLLDEPTNHLDIEMRHALSTALQEFAGAMVIVSHDRHLLRTTTDLLLLVNAGQADEFKGDLDDYPRWLMDNRARDNDKPAAGNDTREHSANARKDRKRQEAEQRRLLQPLRNRLKKLERQVEELMQEQNRLELELSLPDIYAEENKAQLKQLLADKARVDQTLTATEEEWLLTEEELEQVLGD